MINQPMYNQPELSWKKEFIPEDQNSFVNELMCLCWYISEL